MDKSRKNKRWAFTFAELMISLVVISVLSAILYPTIAQFTPNSNKPLFKSAYKTLNEVLTEIVNEQPNGELGTRDAAGVFSPLTAAQLCQRFCEKVNVLPSPKNDGTYASTCAGECGNSDLNKKTNSITTSNGMRWLFEGYDSNTATAPDPDNGCRNCNSEDKNCVSCVYHNPDPKNGNNYALFATPVFTQKTFRIVVDVNASNNQLSQVGIGGRNIFVTNCDTTKDCKTTANGCCGAFMYDYNTTATGIFTTIPNYNLNGDNNITAKEDYNSANLRNQDTFEIHIDRTGKIVAMSPAAWANLEDNVDTGN